MALAVNPEDFLVVIVKWLKKNDDELSGEVALDSYFKEWLHDVSTDSEHLHILLPGDEGTNIYLLVLRTIRCCFQYRKKEQWQCFRLSEPVVLKCDLHERILDPNLIPFSYQYVSLYRRDWDEDECESFCRVYILRWLGWEWVWILLQSVHPEVIEMRMSVIAVAESSSWGDWDEDECDCCCRVFILRWLGWGWVWLLLQSVHPEVIGMRMSVIAVAECSSWGDWDEDECDCCCRVFILRWLGWGWVWLLLQSVHPEVIGMRMNPAASLVKGGGITVPIHTIRVINRIPLDSVCESVLHGMVRFESKCITSSLAKRKQSTKIWWRIKVTLFYFWNEINGDRARWNHKW